MAAHQLPAFQGASSVPPAPPLATVARPARAGLRGQGAIPSNYLWQAIALLVLGLGGASFFCLPGVAVPFAIAALVNASSVNGPFYQGRVDLARANSKKARFWCWVTFWVGVASVLVPALLFLVTLLFAGSVF